jgi:hypothetical protein
VSFGFSIDCISTLKIFPSSSPQDTDLTIHQDQAVLLPILQDHIDSHLPISGRLDRMFQLGDEFGTEFLVDLRERERPELKRTLRCRVGLSAKTYCGNDMAKRTVNGLPCCHRRAGRPIQA